MRGRENIIPFINGLLWNELYVMILENFPYVTQRSLNDDVLNLKEER